MREFRLGRNTTEHYSSLEEMRSAWGLKLVDKKTLDDKKLVSQQNSFCEKHRCRACGKPMIFVGNSNAMICSNEKCKGLKQTKVDKDGNEIISYALSYSLLDELGSNIANTIFS